MPDEPQKEFEFMVSSMLSSKENHKGLVQMMWEGKVAQLTVDQAREIGIHFLECAEAAETDEAMYHMVTEKLGGDAEMAVRFISIMRETRTETYTRKAEEPPST